MNTEELEAADPLHLSVVDVDGGVLYSALSPEVHYHLLSFADVQSEVIFLTPAGQ